MLPSVHEFFVQAVGLCNTAGYGGGLDELRASTDDGENLGQDCLRFQVSGMRRL